ncbi:MAG: hypothetical protein KIG65_06585 [Eubacteriales bacterium]|nr:hypothetical protein [Eubacteriales bacterium]
MKIKTEMLRGYIADLITEDIVDFEIDADEIANTTAIKMVAEIQQILIDSGDSDFETVEKIVRVFEKYKIDSGCCHDF